MHKVNDKQTINKKSQLRIFWIIILILLIVIISIIILIKTNKPDIHLDNNCEELEMAIDKVICYKNLAIEKDNLEICGLSSDKGVEFQCYAIFAEYKLNENICDRIISESQEFKDLKDICISDIAKLKKDINLCEKINSQTLKSDCINLINN